VEPVVVFDAHLVFAGAVEDDLLLLGRERLPRCIELDAVRLRNGFHHSARPAGFFEIPAVRVNRAVGEALVRAGDDAAWIERQLEAQTLTSRACAAWRIERERARLGLRDAAVTIDAGEMLAEQDILRL